MTNNSNQKNPRLVGILFLIACLGFFFYLKIPASDDYVWLYYTGEEIGRRNESIRLNEIAITKLQDAQQPFAAKRVADRRDYFQNYIFGSAAYRLASELTQAFSLEAAPDVAKIAAHSYVYGTISLFILCLLVCCAILLLLDDKRLTLACVIVVFVFVFFRFVPTFFIHAKFHSDGALGLVGKGIKNAFFPTFYTENPNIYAQLIAPGQTPIFDGGTIVSAIWNLVVLFFYPDPNHTMFGVTPRGHFILLTLTAFALRYKQKYSHFYFLIVFSSLFHNSNSILLFAFTLSADLLFRPKVVLRPTAVSAILLMMINFLFRERVDAFSPGLAGLKIYGSITGVLAILLFGVLGHSRRYESLISKVFRKPRERFGEFGMDLLFFFAAWIAVLPYAYWKQSVHASMPDSKVVIDYVFAQLHGRVLTVLRSGYFLAFSLYIIRNLASSAQRKIVGIGFTCFIALLFVHTTTSLYQRNNGFSLAKPFKNALLENAKNLTFQEWKQKDSNPLWQMESAMYFHMTRSLLERQDRISEFFKP